MHLEGLCGNRNIQNILFFLFVNQKCYGNQLQKALKTSLTPIQNALLRLEKGGIIMSSYEGKTRVYQFDPSFPLLEELEQLLRKAYLLLSAEEKKNFTLEPKEKEVVHDLKVIHSFWNKLTSVKKLTFRAKTHSKKESGWQGKGTGEVTVTKEGDHIILFHEKGCWRGEMGEIDFTNVFRWTLEKNIGMISLEHLRRGPDQPVFLFHLVPSSSHCFTTVDAHLCEGDIYFGKIFFNRFLLHFNWRIIGPKKNEEIDYFYS